MLPACCEGVGGWVRLGVPALAGGVGTLYPCYVLAPAEASRRRVSPSVTGRGEPSRDHAGLERGPQGLGLAPPECREEDADGRTDGGVHVQSPSQICWIWIRARCASRASDRGCVASFIEAVLDVRCIIELGSSIWVETCVNARFKTSTVVYSA